MKPDLKMIPVESLESLWSRYHCYQGEGIHPEDWPEGRLDELVEIWEGKAGFILPGGTEYWIPVGGNVDRPRIEGDLAEVLLDCIVDHKCDEEDGAVERHLGPRLPMILFNRKTFGLETAFCMECNRYVNLAEVAKRFDGTRVPEGYEESE